MDLNDIIKQTVPVGVDDGRTLSTQLPPPMAICILLIPRAGSNGAAMGSQLQVQWPPQMDLVGVMHALRAAYGAVEAQARMQDTGLWTPPAA